MIVVGVEGFSASTPYGTSSLHSCGSAHDTYRWTPNVATTGDYDVYIRWTASSTRSTTVPVTVQHAAGTTTRNFNQQITGGTWVLHGRYRLNAGTTGYVQTSDVNGQACADAVRFTRAL